jgi:hypothetical protein
VSDSLHNIDNRKSKIENRKLNDLPSRSLGAPRESGPAYPVYLRSAPRDSPEGFRGWARQDSNLGPRDYESPALTAELQARMIVEVKHSKPLVTNPESIYAAVRWWIEQLPWRAVAE